MSLWGPVINMVCTQPLTPAAEPCHSCGDLSHWARAQGVYHHITL